MLCNLPCLMFLRTPLPPSAHTARRATATLAVGVAATLWCLIGSGDGLTHAAKPKAKAKPPDLKVLSVYPAPLPFVLSEAPLTLTIMVELPQTVPDEALLDVTTLITSPSKFSIRLLTNRQMVAGKDAPDAGDKNGDPRLIEIVQTWDGTDHEKRVVADGIYDYQVQAKLMVPGKNGPLTRVTAWKKRGTFEVKTR